MTTAEMIEAGRTLKAKHRNSDRPHIGNHRILHRDKIDPPEGTFDLRWRQVEGLHGSGTKEVRSGADHRTTSTVIQGEWGTMSHRHSFACYGGQGNDHLHLICGLVESNDHDDLHESYLRIRQKLTDYGAFRTNHGGENRFEVTEAALDALLREAASAPKPMHILDLFHIMWGNAKAGIYIKPDWISLQTRLETLLAITKKDSA